MKDNNVVTPIFDVQIPGLIQPGTFSSKSITTTATLMHAPLTNPRAYYRSKIVTTATGVNPLITAASALFTFIAQLQITPTYQDASQTYQDLVHEIKAFETQAQTQGYRSEIILLARYILCTSLDEAILNSAWGKQSQWSKHKLLATFHSEDWGGERFFIITERLSADPTLHIDLLELIYLCLSLGYSGKFQHMPNGNLLLDDITEKLYQCIRWQRGDIRKELAITNEVIPTVVTPINTANNQATQPLPLWLLTIFTTMLMLTIYAGFNFMLTSSVIPVYQQLTTIMQTYAAS